MILEKDYEETNIELLVSIVNDIIEQNGYDAEEEGIGYINNYGHCRLLTPQCEPIEETLRWVLNGCKGRTKPTIEELVHKCKLEYKNKCMKFAWKYWCMIYDYFEDKPFEELHKVMEQFTNEEVYAITDYGKKSKGYA